MKELYYPRVIDNFVKNHPEFTEIEKDMLHRLAEITYNGKIELWNKEDIDAWGRAFGNCDKWQVESGDLKSFPWKATTMAVCSDFKTKEEAQDFAKWQNEEESKKFKLMH